MTTQPQINGKVYGSTCYDDNCIPEFRELVADLEQALSLLMEREWVARQEDDGYCPSCAGADTHLPDCTWANLLSKYNREVRFHD